MSLIKPTNVSRITAFTAGMLTAGAAFFTIERQLWKGTAAVAQEYGAPKPAPRDVDTELFFGPRTRALLVRKWNQAVDSTVGAAAAELAKRGY